MVTDENNPNEILMAIICDQYCRYSNGESRTQEDLDRECDRCPVRKTLILCEPMKGGDFYKYGDC